jgi:hypothetical protein
MDIITNIIAVTNNPLNIYIVCCSNFVTEITNYYISPDETCYELVIKKFTLISFNEWLNEGKIVIMNLINIID